MTIPSDILKILDLEIGATLALDVTSKGFTARPLPTSARKRYSLTELLHGISNKAAKTLKEQTKSAREASTLFKKSLIE